MSCLAILLFLLQIPATMDSSPAPSPDPEGAAIPQKPFQIQTTVVVTGTHTGIDLEKSPASASVITRQDLENADSWMVDQSLRFLPGLHAFRTKGPQDTSMGVSMRGFNGRGVDGARILVLLDGQPMNSAYDGAAESMGAMIVIRAGPESLTSNFVWTLKEPAARIIESADFLRQLRSVVCCQGSEMLIHKAFQAGSVARLRRSGAESNRQEREEIILCAPASLQPVRHITLSVP